MIITFFVKVTGFARDIVLSYFFGASNISDAYLVSLTIPSVIFGFIGAGILTAYIPTLSRIVNQSKSTDASKFTSNFFNIILLFCTAIFIVTFIFTEPLVKLFALGFSEEVLSMAIKLTRISLLGMFLTTFISLFSGFLQVRNNYLIPALLGLPYNIIIMIAIVLSSQGNYVYLAIGTLIATFSQTLLLIPFIKKKGYKYYFIVNFKDKLVLNTLKNSLPIVLGTAVSQINILVDKTLASLIQVGGISSLNYATRVDLFVQGLFVTSIITTMYPLISSHAAKGNVQDFKKIINNTLVIVIVLIVPVTIGAMLYSTEIITLLFGRGAFDETAINLTSKALLFYSMGMLGNGVREILTRAFYSIQDTVTPVKNSIIGVTLNVILNIILSKFMGISGLALATTISSIITATLLFYSLRKKIGPFGIKHISIALLKVLIASLIMGGISKVSYILLMNVLNGILPILIAIFIGGVIYIVLIYFMKIQDIVLVYETLKVKIDKLRR